MGLFGRLKRGLALTKDGIIVLRHNPTLMTFPLVAGAAGIVFLALLLGGAYGMVDTIEGNETVGYAVLFVAYLVTTFISSFFTAGLVYETRQAFDGKQTDFRRGLNAAWGVKGKLLGWSVIAATIGVVIRAIESSDSRVARIFAWVFSAAWSILTFFVVPVAVLEPDESVVSMFKTSGRIFRGTWGETAIGMIGPGLIAFVVFAVGAVVAFGIFTATGSVLVAAAIVGIFLVSAVLLSATIKGIIKTSLYVYATEGKRPSEFGDTDFQSLNS